MNHRILARYYDRITAATERAGLAVKRRELLAPLRGTVIELGAGTGVNLQYYEQLTELLAVEPDTAMASRFRRRLIASSAGFPVELIVERAAAALQRRETASVDAVVVTLVLCTVADVAETLREVRRVLHPDGRFVVIEHVRGQGVGAALQTALTPVQRLVAGGCHLNRDTRAAIAAAGFDVDGVEEWSLPGSVPLLRSAIAGTARLRAE